MPGLRRVAPFNPASIPGLGLHLNADRIPGVAHGGAVASWPDLSGRGNHTTQGTGSARPTLQTGVLNGRSVVRFDGTDDVLVSEGGGVLGAAAHTLIVVAVRRGGSAAFRGYAALGNSSDATGTRATSTIGHNNDATQKHWYGGDDLVTPVGANVANDTPYLLSKTHDGTKTQGYLNGAADGSATVTAYNLANTGVLVGSYVTNVGFAQVDIARVLVYNRALAAHERQYIERGLGAYYGLRVA